VFWCRSASPRAEECTPCARDRGSERLMPAQNLLQAGNGSSLWDFLGREAHAEGILDLKNQVQLGNRVPSGGIFLSCIVRDRGGIDVEYATQGVKQTFVQHGYYPLKLKLETTREPL